MSKPGAIQHSVPQRKWRKKEGRKNDAALLLGDPAASHQPSTAPCLQTVDTPYVRSIARRVSLLSSLISHVEDEVHRIRKLRCKSQMGGFHQKPLRQPGSKYYLVRWLLCRTRVLLEGVVSGKANHFRGILSRPLTDDTTSTGIRSLILDILETMSKTS